jgi:type IV secretory pathway VirJ component
MKKILFIISIALWTNRTIAQTTSLPVQAYYAADTTKPLLFYISGDGGLNKFSTSLMLSFLNQGYATVALDARTYFWKKKNPQQAANDVNALLHQYLKNWHRKSYIFMGYSFGADVSPFIYNRLQKDIQDRARDIVLLSPSTTTDFEIHVTDMLGFGKSNGVSVTAEINKINKPVLFVYGRDEKDIPAQQVTIRNKQLLILDGGHHFEGDTKELSKQILSRLR